MSKYEESKPFWFVIVEINHAAKEYRGINVVEASDLPTPTLDTYVQVQAADEIGAFNEAQKVLHRLGFRIGA